MARLVPTALRAFGACRVDLFLSDMSWDRTWSEMRQLMIAGGAFRRIRTGEPDAATAVTFEPGVSQRA